MSAKSQRVSQLILRGLLVCGSFFVGLCVIEVALELTDSSQVNLKPSRRLVLREWQRGFASEIVPHDPMLRRLDSTRADGVYEVSVDGDGYLEHPYNSPHPELSIVFLGGSTTECLYVEPGQRFPGLVAKSLQAATGKDVATFNGGMSGNTSMHSNLNLIGKVVPAVPDYCVLLHNINDLTLLMYQGSYWGSQVTVKGLVAEESTAPPGRMSPGVGLKSLARNLFPQIYQRAARLKALASGAQDEWADVRGHQITEAQLLEAHRQFARSLRLFVAQCRIHGIEPVLMTQASRWGEGTEDPIDEAVEGSLAGTGVSAAAFREQHAAFNEVVRSVSQDEGCLLIDLAAVCPSTDEYLYDPVHLTEAGCELIAGEITMRIAESLAAASDE